MNIVSNDIPSDRHTMRALFLQGNHAEAASIGTKLGQRDPLAPHPLHNLLTDAVAANRREDFLSVLEYAAENTPEDPRLLELQAMTLQQVGLLSEAERAVRAALAKRPEHQGCTSLLISILTQAGRFTEAERLLRELHTAQPNDNALAANLAVVLTAQERFSEALPLYRHAIALDPTHAQIRLNHSIALLKSGQFTLGWTEHEWRLSLPGHTSLPQQTLLPNLTRDLDLTGQRVLVTQEEGLGDTLMYLRFIPELADRGAKITVWTADALGALTERVDERIEVQVGGDTPEFDYHCPFISLPRAFSATSTPFGVKVPYLKTSPDKSAFWARRLESDKKLKVGIVWGGAPRAGNSDAFMLDRRRSIPLASLAPLRKLRHVTLYSLQKGPAAQQLRDDPGGIIDWMPEVEDMDDTAALIDNLDLVVSVDTSIVHLAGGLGKRVILLDRVNPCWRWLHGRTDSPWYPNLNIVRQTAPWDWSDVVKRVVALLRKEHAK